MEKVKTKWKDLFSSRGFLGCCMKPPLILDRDEPSHVLELRGKEVKKPKQSDDFWSASSYEMDNSTVQSQRHISSTGIQKQGENSSVAESSCPYEFVNHGLILWNQIRQQWTEIRSSQTRPQVGQTRISSSATYENLLKNNKPFPQPIPLPEMVDFLVDIWEQEGLYDYAENFR